MNAPGTLDRPSGHGPMKQDLMIDFTLSVKTSERGRSDETASPRNRTREMQLMPETLSRTRMQDYLTEAESDRVARRVITARRMQRKAERASRRACRALATALMH